MMASRRRNTRAISAPRKVVCMRVIMGMKKNGPPRPETRPDSIMPGSFQGLGRPQAASAISTKPKPIAT